MAKSKKRIILFSVIAVFLAVSAIIISVFIKNNTQYPKQEKMLSDKQRIVLTENFTPVEFTEKKEPKRIIDNTHPLNLLNYYGDEPVLDLWSSIPDNQKPYTVLLIIPGHTLLPENDSALEMLETTAQICEENQIPYAIQNMNGEIAPEERLPISYLMKNFAEKHQYFYGLNAAELYNGIYFRGEAESNYSQYIIDCINLCAQYGGFFFWTDTNRSYDSGVIMEWFEKNEAFYSAFKENSRYICMMNKESFGNPATYSCMQGLWLAGLIGNWGVASDWWHWAVDGDKLSLFGEYDELVDNEWDGILNFPENMYVQSMMLVMSAGGTCFKAEAPNFSTSCAGKAIGGFEYGISPLFDRIISGQISIPSREEVLAETPVAVIGLKNYPDFNYNYSESNLYPCTGKYGIIPLLPSNLRKNEIEIFNKNCITLVNSKNPQSFYDDYYSDINSDTYLKRISTQWYFIHNVENERCKRSGTFESVLSSAKEISINAEEHTSAIITENRSSIDFYISNYRTDKKEMVRAVDDAYMQNNIWYNFARDFLVLDNSGNPIGLDDSKKRTTVITINGTYNEGKPHVVIKNSKDGSGYQNRPYELDESWNSETQTLTLTFNHNGILDFSVLLDETNKEYTASNQETFIPFDIKETNASYDELKQLIDSLSYEENHIYNEYSYMCFNNQFEKAQIIISENTYSQNQVNKAIKDLKQAYKNLLDLTPYGTMLQNALNDLTNEETKSAFDNLLREALANRVYTDGRSQELRYQLLYKQKAYNKNAKAERLEEKSEALSTLLSN